MGTSLFGFTPFGFILFCGGICILVVLIAMIIIPSELKKRVKGHTYCTFVTKDKKKKEGLVPTTSSGRVMIPARWQYSKDSPKMYFVTRGTTLFGFYPPITLTLFGMTPFQVEAPCALFEEGQPNAILPSDAPQQHTPAMIRAISDEKTLELVARKTDEEMKEGKAGGLAKVPLSLWIALGLILCSSVFGAWVSLQGANNIEHLIMWFQGGGG